MVERKKEDFEKMDERVRNARIELEIEYRALKEEIKKIDMNDNRYYKKLVSMFDCEPK